MRVFELPAAGGRERGRAHGEEFRGEIAILAGVRTYLTRTIGGFEDDEAVLELARQHLPVLEAFDADLHAELCGIAEGAGVEAERIVVLNHYTDLRDLGSAAQAPPPDGCSILWAHSGEGSIAAQTWDMHVSAMPHVVMMRVPPVAGEPGAWVLSLAGCLGMAGVGDHRVAAMINNLTSTDARVGVVWSALVRKALRQDSASAAYRVVDGSTLGSGHHYLFADAGGAVALESSGTLKRKTLGRSAGSSGAAYVHTNHCIDGDVAACSRVPPTSTSHARYDWLRQSLASESLRGLEDAWERLGSTEGFPSSISTLRASPELPHGTATCGALAVNLYSGEILACAGLTHRATGQRFTVGQS